MFGFKLRKDNRGLSLVELICAIAILGIITATVGGAMVVATHSYRQSTVETSLQQEAQFTANTIESLIIDATTEVNWDASTGVLEIKNEGIGRYVITYDGAARELRYTEYAADMVTPIEPQNELLAAHVSNFTVEAGDFKQTRNVVLTIEMEHEGSKYVTAYNVTSRNNPSNVTGPAASAQITVDPIIVLEPNQSYLLGVTVSGASTAYNCSIADSDAGPLGIQTSVAVVSGGIQIDVGNAETGGADQDLQLNIWTTALNEMGDSLASKVVHVHIRRVTDLTIKELGVTGERGKKDAVYTISVPRENYAGIYLDQIGGTPSDFDYVDPYTLKWEVCPGASSLVQLVDPSAVYNEVIQFKLKDDLPTGTTNVVQAVSLHSKGTEGTPKNKTGLPYNELVVKPFSITVSADSEADIQRGRVAYLYPQGAGKSAADWVHDMTGDEVSNVNALRFYYRYRTDDWVHTTTGYSEGTWMSNTEGGKHGGAEFFKFRPADFSPVYYAKQYNLQVLMAVEYDTGGVRKWYPTDIQDAVNANGGSFPSTLTNYHVSEDISDATAYIKKYTIPPMSLKFTEVYTPAWTETIWWPTPVHTVDHPAATLNIDSYITDSQEGLGSISNPIPMYKSSPWYFKGEMLADYVSDSLGVRSLVSRAKYYDVTDAANPVLLSGAEAPELDFEDGDADGFDTTNNAIIKPKSTWNGGFQVGHKYKLVFDSFQGGFGDESYADAAVTGKGEIYFTLLDGTP